MSPGSRKPIDVHVIESAVGELKAIAWLMRETCEVRGDLEEDGKDAVHFLACLVRERVATLDEIIDAATNG